MATNLYGGISAERYQLRPGDVVVGAFCPAPPSLLGFEHEVELVIEFARKTLDLLDARCGVKAQQFRRHETGLPLERRLKDVPVGLLELRASAVGHFEEDLKQDHGFAFTTLPRRHQGEGFS